MSVLPTKIDGDMIFEPRVFKADQSFSPYDTIRVLHAQKGEYSQAKLVRVTQGKVLDVVVDIRGGSPTYGEHIENLE